MASACQHDPCKENPTVSTIEQSASYVILYCSICKKTEIYRENKSPARRPTATNSSPAKVAQRASPVNHRSSLARNTSGPFSPLQATPPGAAMDSAASDDNSSDSEDDLQAVRSGIDAIYAQLEALRKKQAKKDAAVRPVAPPAAPARLRASASDSSLSSKEATPPSNGSGLDLRPKPLLPARPPRKESPNPAAGAPPAKGEKDRAAERGDKGKPASPGRQRAPEKGGAEARKGSKGQATPLTPNVPVPHIGSLEDSERVQMMKYDVNTQKWSNSEARLVIANKPFQEGNLRAAFHCVDVTAPNTPKHFVCKMSKDPNEDPRTYYIDVEMQCLAQKIAEEFNKRNPPKQVSFVDAYLIKCLQRKGEPILAVEPYMHGKYVKHTNNFGFVSKEDRNTPQAFSHFSYCYTQGQTLVCDIQGVDDFYTDPQIHSRDGKGWGHGNMGAKGMLKFFETHHCNAICRYLRLPPNKPKEEDKGTVIPKAMPKGNVMMPPKIS